jgi:hypothetical protein
MMMAYLSDKPSIEDNILIGTVQCLFQEGKENRNNNHSLQCLSKDDEEHWD